MTNGKIQPFTSLDQSKHHCYTLSTTCTLFKLASEVGPRTISIKCEVLHKAEDQKDNRDILGIVISISPL